jgi:hypothetical protein
MRNTTLLQILVLMLCLAPLAAPRAESARSLNEKGRGAFEQSEFGQAAERFTEAAEKTEKERARLILEYNIGAARTAEDKAEEAMSKLEKVRQARDSELAARASFGAGVVNYGLAEKAKEAGDLQGALEKARGAVQANIEALRANPVDRDARVNLELAALLRDEIEQEIERQEQEKQQNQDSQDKNQEKPDEKNQQDNQDPKQEQERSEPNQNQNSNQEQNPSEPDPNKQDSQEDQKNEDEGKQGEDEQKPEPEKSEESAEPKDEGASKPDSRDAEGEQGNDSMEDEAILSLLNLLEDDDNEALKRMMRLRHPGARDLEKAW